MAKFCANCGATMNDNDNICGQCGTPATAGQGATVTPGPMGGSNGIDFAKLNENNRLVKIGIGVVAVIVVIFVLSKIVGSFSSGPEKPIKKMLSAIEDNDAEAFADSMSSYVIAAYEEETDEDFIEYCEDILDKSLDSYEEEVDGQIDDISYEVIREKEWSDRKFEEWLEDHEDDFDEYGLDQDDFKGITEVKVKRTVEGVDGKTKHETVTYKAIKESGGWKLLLY